jgi:hypothetical protein
LDAPKIDKSIPAKVCRHVVNALNNVALYNHDDIDDEDDQNGEDDKTLLSLVIKGKSELAELQSSPNKSKEFLEQKHFQFLTISSTSQMDLIKIDCLFRDASVAKMHNKYNPKLPQKMIGMLLLIISDL